MYSNSIRNFVPMQNKYDRVVILVDMDCFYCQVEEKLDPKLKGQPLAVVQYNAWRGGGIIAVNYAARAKGVTRHMRGDEAKEECPEIQLVKVPNVREKADLTKYRDAGKEVASVLQRYTQLLERASVDEAYLDITEAVNKRLEALNKGTFILQPDKLLNTYAVGYQNIGEYVTNITATFANPERDNYETLNMTEYDEKIMNAVRQSDIRLLIGASISSEIRADVKATTGYECSAGIAHNKILAKLCCGINKPNKQTILPLAQTPKYLEALPIRKIKGLGAKFGEEVCERLGIQFFGQMLKFTESELQRKFDEKNGSWLYNICRGIDLEAVTPRFYSKSIGCCKKFPGLNNITGLKTLKHWLLELANEISDRLDKDSFENNRKAKQMVVSFIQDFDGKEVSSSRSAPLLSYNQDALAQQSLDLIKTNTKLFLRPGSDGVLNNAVRFLGISVGKFETVSNTQNTLQDMFANQVIKTNKSKATAEANNQDRNDNATTSNHNVSDINQNNLDDGENPQVANEEKEEQSFLLNYLKKGSQQAAVLKTNLECTETPIGDDSREVNEVKEAQSFLLNYLKKGTQQAIVPENDLEFTKTPTTEIQEIKTANEEDGTNSKSKSFLLSYLKKASNSSNLTENKASTVNETSLVENANSREENLNTESKMLETSSTSFFLNLLEKQKSPKLASSTQENVSNKNTENTENKANNPYVETDADNQPSTSKRKYDQLNDESNDYKTTYAEFAMPELNTEILETIKCDICGVQLPRNERAIQMHQDHHFAKQLSEQQRDEYRAEIKTKIVPPKQTTQSSVNKKTKTNAAKKSPTIKADIKQFLRPHTNNTTQLDRPTTPKAINTQLLQPQLDNTQIEIIDTQNVLETTLTVDGSDYIVCPSCGKSIKQVDMPEHEDYHLAKELQRELNRLEVHSVITLNKSTATSNQTRKSINGSKSTNNLGSKPITQFFSSKN